MQKKYEVFVFHIVIKHEEMIRVQMTPLAKVECIIDKLVKPAPWESVLMT